MGAQGNDLSAELWRNIAVRLNALGGVEHTLDKWKEVSLFLFKIS